VLSAGGGGIAEFILGTTFYVHGIFSPGSMWFHIVFHLFVNFLVLEAIFQCSLPGRFENSRERSG
jgi:hypothetical protein